VTKIREIPRDKLKEIRRFIHQHRRKLTAEQMAEEIKKRFGVELKPSQVHYLSRPEPRKVTLPEDVVKFLEEEFGGVGEGIKQVVALAKHMSTQAPEHLRKAVRSLAGELLTYDEACSRLRELGYSDPSAVIRELARLGFVHNERGMLRFYRVRRPPEFALLQFLMGFSK